MSRTLTESELFSLFSAVFRPGSEDAVMTFIIDVPDARLPDHPLWKERRRMAVDWWTKTLTRKEDHGLKEVLCLWYPNVGSNNNDLPETLYFWDGNPEEANADAILEGQPISRDAVLERTDIIVAATELSATAPCKMLAKTFHFRGATLPGFNEAMIPALGIDYAQVDRKIQMIKAKLDRAETQVIEFLARGIRYSFTVDLRYRQATASSGMFHAAPVVGNLPSGEAYIVPYEGERDRDPSRTSGILPVQFENEIVEYVVEGNRAIAVRSKGPWSDKERAFLEAEPAYGNIAEIGHGILGEFGMQAIGNVLMDEKLGLHIAFGRSEHFGGIVSPASFRKPEHVIHIDRVYVPSLQPDISVARVELEFPLGERVLLMQDNTWIW